MKIPRSLATRLMQRALRHQEDAQLALIIDHQPRYFHSGEEWIEQAQRQTDAIRVYNQHPLALEAVEALPAADGERRIEIFQDTEGVFGLRAWQMDGKLQKPVTLEFAD